MFWFNGVRARIVSPLIGICMLLSLLSGWLVRSSNERQSREHIRARAASIAHAICHLAESTRDEVVLQRFVAAMATEADVKLIVVATGEPLVVVAASRPDWIGLTSSQLPDPEHTARDLSRAVVSQQVHCEFEHDDEDSVDFTIPLKTRIRSSNPLVWANGAVMLHLDGRPHLKQQAASTAGLLLALIGIIALAAAIAYTLLSLVILRPMNEIARVAHRTADGERTVRVNSRRTDELGQLAADVDAMLDVIVKREAEEVQAKEAAVSAQRQMESALAELACSNFALDEHAFVAITDLSGVITYVNDKFCEISQYSRNELIGRTHRIINSGHHPKSFWAHMWRQVASGEAWHGEVCNRAKDGTLYWVDTTIVPFKNQAGITTKYVAIRTDITERKLFATKLAESQERFELAVRGSNDGIWDWNISTDQVYYSPRFKELLGYAENEFPNHLDSFAQHLHHDDAQATWAAVQSHLNDDTPYDVTYRLRTKTGDWCWFRAKGIAIRSTDGSAKRMAGSISDITELKAIEEQLSHDALHDHLTGLPNRAFLRNRLRRVLNNQSRSTKSYSLMFIDLDRFKFVNDSLGHEAGDELLRQIANRLRESVRSNDSFIGQATGNISARIGGDEFVVLLEELPQPKDALSIADRLLLNLNQPYQIGEHEVISTASIGIVLGNRTYHCVDDLLRDADIAMYEAKRRGKGRHVVFEDSMQSAAKCIMNVAYERPFGLDVDSPPVVPPAAN